jgi:hypothetical protein
MAKLPLCIDPAVQQALIDYASKNRISTLYAGQSCLCKSLRSEGLLKEDDYQRLMQKYTKPLCKEEPPEPKTPEEQKQQQVLDEKDRYFGGVLSQWDLDHKPSWKIEKLKEAEAWQTKCENAKLLVQSVADKVFIK